MKLRKLTDYAIRCIRAVAVSNTDTVISGKIAEMECIPKAYVLTVLAYLRDAGIMESSQNRHFDKGGGYRLIKDPNDITLYDVIKITEGEIKINSCLYDDDCCVNKTTCKVHKEFDRINDILIKELSKKSLSQILSE